MIQQIAGRTGRANGHSRMSKSHAKIGPQNPQLTEGLYLGRELPHKTKVTVLPDDCKLTLPCLVDCGFGKIGKVKAQLVSARMMSYHIVRHQNRWYCDPQPAQVDRNGKVAAPIQRTPEELQAVETARYFANANDDSRDWLFRDASKGHKAGRYRRLVAIPNRTPTRDSIDRYLHPNRNERRKV